MSNRAFMSDRRRRYLDGVTENPVSRYCAEREAHMILQETEPFIFGVPVYGVTESWSTGAIHDDALIASEALSCGLASALESFINLDIQ